MGKPNEPITDERFAELAHWGSERELNTLDALMWRTERPPSDSWTGVVLELLDSTPEWDKLRKAHEWALHMVPRFTERVVTPLVPIGPPLWSADPSFDLSNHLQRVTLPAPGSLQQVLELAQELGVTPLDQKRPPWKAIFVDGLEGGRSAYILQAHHVLMDGAAATQLFSRVLSPTREAPAPEWPESQARPTFGPGKAALYDAARLVRRTPGLLYRFAKAITQMALHPAKTGRYVASISRVAQPPARTASPLLADVPRKAWRFGVLECELADLKKAGRAAGGTVNDAFVSAILGGLRAYHARLGLDLDDVPISMPVSVRRADDPMGGNRFTGAFFSAPSSVTDPAKRIQAMRERVSRVRSEPALDFINTVTPLFNYVPAPVVSAALGKLAAGAALTTSSWPGVQSTVYMAGARFDRMFVFGPLPGTAMCAALCTHGSTCCVAINADGDVFTDLPALWASLREGLDEVLALAAD